MNRNLLKLLSLVLFFLNSIVVLGNTKTHHAIHSFQKTTLVDDVIITDVIKQGIVDFKTLNDKIEISETEIEEEEISNSDFSKDFDFFKAYFVTEICENAVYFTTNRLSLEKRIAYLSTTIPLNIIFCVYRI